MSRNVKSKKYSMRITPEALSRIKTIAIALDTTVPDLIGTAVLHVFSHATSPAAYLKLKADTIVSSTPRLPAP